MLPQKLVYRNELNREYVITLARNDEIPRWWFEKIETYRVVLSDLKCFKWKLYRCICWLIVEVILRNARCNDEIHMTEFIQYLNLDQSVYRQINTIVGVVRFWNILNKTLLNFDGQNFGFVFWRSNSEIALRRLLVQGYSKWLSGYNFRAAIPHQIRQTTTIWQLNSKVVSTVPRDRVCVCTGNESTNENRHWIHHRSHATDSLERNWLSGWCL